MLGRVYIYLYIPAEATKERKELGCCSHLSPALEKRGHAALLHMLITDPANFISDYLCFFMSSH